MSINPENNYSAAGYPQPYPRNDQQSPQVPPRPDWRNPATQFDNFSSTSPPSNSHYPQTNGDTPYRHPNPSPGPPVNNTLPSKKYSEFNSNNIKEMAQQSNIFFPENVVEQVVAAVDSGKHIILTGPPGTGKTSLAQIVAEVATKAMMCTGFTPTTATSEWTTFETIGGIQPTSEGMVYRPGLFVDAIDNGKWLIIDEMNRANFDRAFGQLFTILSGQSVVLPFKMLGNQNPISLVPAGTEVPSGTTPISVAQNWRIIATMNVFDKNLLFDLSYALMRRFAFIEVPCPPWGVYDHLIELHSGSNSVVKKLLSVLEFLQLGPAVFIDAAKYEVRRLGDHVTASRVLYEIFYAYFLPQLEGVPEEKAFPILEAVDSMLDPAEKQTLHRNIYDVLGYKFEETQ